MHVTDIQEFKNNRLRIFLDGELAFVLYKGELSDFGIAKDSELSDQAYDKIMNEVLVKRGKMRVLKLLTDRPYSEHSLRSKLSESLYPAKVIDEAIAYAKSFGYIDDDKYAADLYESLALRYPVKVILQKMKQKGLDDEVIQRCLAETDNEREQNEENLLKKLILKKCKGVIPGDPKEKEKLMRFLAGKGFSYLQISEALKCMDEDM